MSDAVCSELLGAAAEGPRASDKFAAVAAAVVAGLAGSVGAAEVAANFISRLGSRAEEAVEAGDSLRCVACRAPLGSLGLEYGWRMWAEWCVGPASSPVSSFQAHANPWECLPAALQLSQPGHGGSTAVPGWRHAG